MPEKSEFALEVVSVRLVRDAPLYYEEPVDSPEKAVDLLGSYMCEFDREVVCVLNMKSNMVPINAHFVSIGTLNEAMSHPREIMKASVLSNAASMMLLHCHPSGNLLPSREDTMMTDRMIKVCEMMGIPLIDHIIVGGDNREYFSFKEKKLLKNPKIMLSTDYRTLDFKSAMVAERGKGR